MKRLTPILCGSLLFGGLLSAQLVDKVIVDLPYPTQVGDTVIEPGKYEFREMDSAAGKSQIMFVRDGGTAKHRATAMSIPVLDNNTPEETKVILTKVGNTYQLDKIWIVGKNYGYQFPLQPELERETPTTNPNQESLTQRSSAVRETQEVEIARTQQVEETVQTRTPVTTESGVNNDVTAQNRPEPVTDNQVNNQRDETLLAQNQTPQRSQFPDNDAVSMPETASNWTLTLLAGALIGGLGLLLLKRVHA